MVRSGEERRRDELRPAEGGFNPRLWPFVLTVSFGIVFMAIADLAWLTAIGTTAPWFTSSTSAQMYTTTLMTATLATLVLASLAASRLASLEAKSRDVARTQNPREATDIPIQIGELEALARGRQVSPEGLDEILAELGEFAEGPKVEVRERPGRPVQVSVPRPTRPARLAGIERGPGPTIGDALRRARRLVWQTVTGPLTVFLIFIALSGAMLPGSGGFAQTHFQINTGFVLFLGYGWPFLVAWTIAAIVLLHGPLRIESFEPADLKALFRPRRGEPSRYR